MAKIEMITLKDMEIKEVDGEYQQIFSNEKQYPAAITNYGLGLGEKLGLLEGSNLTDLLKIASLEQLMAGGGVNEQALEADDTNTTKYLKGIYIALIGINPKLELSYEEFLQKYHADSITTMKTYARLVMNTLPSTKNKFAEGMEQSTKKK
ncbi:hypothetical protein M948_18270 [Virgibacillus sp. CM-4]|uniref:hypothetical protein n=1 Tax=Virgibacillus sp. CM-4 TaxID=1354277 RepID=UPI0003882A52|nr:hypothetical protein [Virgibacillus sp. CM-4]EQB35046.1 hypothetical protein M948_18270 [Virgibacillus sp. CM-4]